MRIGLVSGLFALLLPLASCVEFNAECSPPIDQPDEVLAFLAAPVPVDHNVVRRRESPLSNAIADAYLAALGDAGIPKPDVAFDNSGGIRDLGLCLTRTALAKGPLTRKVLRDVVPFSNQLVVVKVSERELFDILEHGVSSLAVPNVSPGGQFLQVSGLRYEVDCKEAREQLSLSSGEREARGKRVRTITLGGRTIQRDLASADATVRVALPDFLAKGGDNFVDLKGKTLELPSPERYTYNVLEDALLKAGSTAERPLRLAVDSQNPRIVLHDCE
jgi:5'-nucleotidase/UDP-sugar diphosphatase